MAALKSTASETHMGWVDGLGRSAGEDADGMMMRGPVGHRMARVEPLHACTAWSDIKVTSYLGRGEATRAKR